MKVEKVVPLLFLVVGSLASAAAQEIFPVEIQQRLLERGGRRHMGEDDNPGEDCDVMSVYLNHTEVDLGHVRCRRSGFSWIPLGRSIPNLRFARF